MADIALRVEELSKRYRIGLREASVDTLGGAIAAVARRPLENFRRLRRMARFSADGDAVDIIWALRDVDFEVERGEVVGVVGRNGAGKSTLLKILSKITEPTRGRALVRGNVASLLEVGTGFHPELTGRENVYLNGAILGMRKSEIKRKFDEIVDFSGVAKFIDTPIKRYSSGMQVRLAFSVAAHLEPEILLVDEVLAVGDASFQQKCLGKMQGVSESGRTVLFVSHNMPAVTRLCKRVILLNEGEVVADGPAAKVVAGYLSAELGTASERRFDDSSAGTGNEWVRVRSVRAVDTNHQTVDTVDVRESIGIEVVIEVLLSRSRFVPMIALYDEHGVHVMNAMDTDPSWREPRKPGRYVSTAWIPANLLAEGTLSVSVVLSTHSARKGLKQAHIPDAVAFRVVDPIKGDSARGDFVGPWGGAVRPLLEWTTDSAVPGAPGTERGSNHGARSGQSAGKPR